MNTIKGAIRSKTMWFNIITGVLAVLSLKEITTLMPQTFLPNLAVINALGNLVLRMLTNQPLSGKAR